MGRLVITVVSTGQRRRSARETTALSFIHKDSVCAVRIWPQLQMYCRSLAGMFRNPHGGSRVSNCQRIVVISLQCLHKTTRVSVRERKAKHDVWVRHRKNTHTHTQKKRHKRGKKRWCWIWFALWHSLKISSIIKLDSHTKFYCFQFLD